MFVCVYAFSLYAVCVSVCMPPPVCACAHMCACRGQSGWSLWSWNYRQL